MARGAIKRVALDIGSSAIKLCELTQTKNGLVLTKYAKTDLRVDPALPADERTEIRIEGIRETLLAVKNKYKKSIFAVPGQSVFVRNRELPSVPASKVADIVRYEITQQIPFPLRDIALDYQILKQAETGEYDVMMVAIKVDAIDAYGDVIQGAKLKIDTVDVGPVAAYNWMNFLGEFSEQSETVACVDFGAATTDIVVVKDGFLRFTRSLTLAGNHATEAIKNALDMSFLEAERVKVEQGTVAPRDRQESPVSGKDESTQRACAAIEQVLSRLVDEIRRSLAFFRSLPEGGPVTRVLISGGGAALPGLVPFLQERLHINAIEIFNPLKGIQLAEGVERAAEDALLLSVPLGLAVRNHISPAIEINLISPRLIEAEKRKEQAVYWGLTFAAMLLIAVSVIPLKHQEYLTNLKLKQAKETELQLYTTYDTEMNSLQAKRTQLKMKVKAINELPDMRRNWLNVLKTLKESLPNGVWLSSVQADNIVSPTAAAATPAGATPAAATRTSSASMIMRMRGRSGGSGTMTGGGTSASLTIQPARFSAIGGRGSMRGRGMAGAAGLLGGSPASLAGQAGGSLPPVNGLTFAGYAPDTETVVNLYENVQKNFKNKKLFKEIIFDPQNVVEVDRLGLTNVGLGGTTGRTGMLSRYGGGASRSRMSRMGIGGARTMGFGMGGLGGYSSAMQPGLMTASQVARDTVWQFTMRVIMW